MNPKKLNIPSSIKKYQQSVFWLLVLLGLYFAPTSTSHFSLCIFKFIGFETCYGCGIGHAIQQTLQFNFSHAFHYHWFGVPATAGIIFVILKPIFFTSKFLCYDTK